MENYDSIDFIVLVTPGHRTISSDLVNKQYCKSGVTAAISVLMEVTFYISTLTLLLWKQSVRA